MMRHFSVFLMLSGLLAGCGDSSDGSKPHHALVSPPASVSTSDQPIAPIPLTAPFDAHFSAEKVALGARLFAEPMLSGDGKVSCASCHPLDRGGTLNTPFAHLPGRPPTKANVPTVFNAAFNFRLNWDGGHETLEALVDVPMLGKAAMASSWGVVVERLSANPAYRAAFEAIYPDGVSADNVRDIIVAFERTLITPNARFDRFLRGDEAALSAREREGFTLFQNFGCISCHQGVNVGGNMFQTFGVMDDYFANHAALTEADLGRYSVTGRESDRFVFRVPTLRNIALTAPYFHDGSAPTLEAAIRIMIRYQLGRTMTDEQVTLIAEFLATLTGEYQGQPL